HLPPNSHSLNNRNTVFYLFLSLHTKRTPHFLCRSLFYVTFAPSHQQASSVFIWIKKDTTRPGAQTRPGRLDPPRPPRRRLDPPRPPR
ncbi:unnamed protein product, partial [Prunus brigantina]